MKHIEKLGSLVLLSFILMCKILDSWKRILYILLFLFMLPQCGRGVNKYLLKWYNKAYFLFIDY